MMNIWSIHCTTSHRFQFQASTFDKCVSCFYSDWKISLHFIFCVTRQSDCGSETLFGFDRFHPDMKAVRGIETSGSRQILAQHQRERIYLDRSLSTNSWFASMIHLWFADYLIGSRLLFARASGWTPMPRNNSDTNPWSHYPKCRLCKSVCFGQTALHCDKRSDRRTVRFRPHLSFEMIWRYGGRKGLPWKTERQANQ